MAYITSLRPGRFEVRESGLNYKNLTCKITRIYVIRQLADKGYYRKLSISECSDIKSYSLTASYCNKKNMLKLLDTFYVKLTTEWRSR